MVHEKMDIQDKITHSQARPLVMAGETMLNKTQGMLCGRSNATISLLSARPRAFDRHPTSPVLGARARFRSRRRPRAIAGGVQCRSRDPAPLSSRTGDASSGLLGYPAAADRRHIRSKSPSMSPIPSTCFFPAVRQRKTDRQTNKERREGFCSRR